MGSRPIQAGMGSQAGDLRAATSRATAQSVMAVGSSQRVDVAGAALVFYACPESIVQALPHSALLDILSVDERERHARFRVEPDRDAYLVAHALTRRVLGCIAGVSPGALEFEPAQHGRPEIIAPAAARDLSFNLSHTRGLVACAVARGHRIGVDSEFVGRGVELLGVARRVFSGRELSGLHALSGAAQRQRFFELWTLKEAYVKAIGNGLAGPLRAISFAPEQADPVPVHFDLEADDDAGAWCFRRHVPGPNHLLAVALRAGPSAAVRFREVGPDQLLGSLLE